MPRPKRAARTKKKQPEPTLESPDELAAQLLAGTLDEEDFVELMTKLGNSASKINEVLTGLGFEPIAKDDPDVMDPDDAQDDDETDGEDFVAGEEDEEEEEFEPDEDFTPLSPVHNSDETDFDEDEEDEESDGPTPKSKSKKRSSSSSKSSTKSTKKKSSSTKSKSPTVKKLNPKESRELIVNYMRKLNRPYNLTTLYENLGKKVHKTSMQKILDKAVEDGDLVRRDYGKQSLYCFNQENYENIDVSDIAALEDTLKEKTAQLAQITEECSNIEAQFESLQSQLPDDELDREIQKVEQEIENYKKKIKPFKSGKIKFDDAKIKRLEKSISARLTDWKKLKKKVSRVVGQIQESQGESKAKIYETYDILEDNDEEERYTPEYVYQLTRQIRKNPPSDLTTSPAKRLCT